MTADEIELALDLAWEVFLQFEAPDYTQEGVEVFFKSLNDMKWLSMLRMFGAFWKGEMVGMIATRNNGSHIALFFVRAEHQKTGVGRKLFNYILQKNLSNFLTVNSSPYAVAIYRHFGFQDMHEEQEVKGVRFTPMKLQL